MYPGILHKRPLPKVNNHTPHIGAKSSGRELMMMKQPVKHTKTDGRAEIERGAERDDEDDNRLW
jgi:hypothetical protein